MANILFSQPSENGIACLQNYLLIKSYGEEPAKKLNCNERSITEWKPNAKRNARNHNLLLISCS